MIQEVKVDAPYDHEKKVSGFISSIVTVYFGRCDMKEESSCIVNADNMILQLRIRLEEIILHHTDHRENNLG